MKDLEVPMREQVVDRTSLLLTMPWVDWFLRLVTRLPTAQRVTVKAPYMSSIPATAMMPLQRGVIGFLRVSYLLRVTQPASSAGQVVLTLRWTDAQPELKQSRTLNGVGSSVEDFQDVLMYADCSQPVTYEVAYSTSGTNPLQYMLDLVVEQVNG